jgi:3-phenylpropionate/trans-cinnamate dioxygenase ferredoxin component
MEPDFVTVARLDDLADGAMRSVDIDGEMLILVRRGDAVYCLDDVCTHDGGSLSDGEYWDHQVKCPRHGARFDVRTGAALCMPATQPTRTHQVRIDNGNIQVRLNVA